MSHQIKMPKVAMAMNEGTITQWFKGDGEQVEKGEPLFEIETEKTAYEVEAPVSGQLQILVSAGETVKVETVIGALGDDVAVEDVLPISEPENNAGAEPTEVLVVEQLPPAEQLSPAEPGKRIKISPLAKKLADQNNIDLSLLSASGAHGRIKKRDIEEYLSNRSSAMPKNMGFERVKLSPMRQAIASGVMGAINGQAMTPNAIEVSMENLIAVRESFKGQKEPFAASVSYQAFFIKAQALASRDVPITNARLDDGYVDIFHDINVAFAVAVDDSNEVFSGLVMPVIRNADKKGILEIQAELTQLVERARARQLTPSDMDGATVTLSSTAGMVEDYMISTPLLNQGQSFIGQPGNIVDRPVVRNGTLVAGKIMTYCFTFDHRVMDGVPACQAASRFKTYIETPSLMLR